MSEILFSVVIPTYNRAPFIGKAIRSVLDQTERNFEVIVVDDGSTDSTRDVVAASTDPRVRYFYKTNGERGAARNFGVTQGNGRFVAFLDSDDYLLPNHLAMASAFINSHEGVKAFHQSYEFRDETGRTLRSVTQTGNINERILFGNPLSCNGIFVERKILLQNPFNEDRRLSSLEDWELWIRLAARMPILNSSEVTSVIIQHNDRSVMSADVSRIVEKIKVFCECVLQDASNQAVYGNRLSRTVASARMYAALHIVMAGEKKLGWSYLLKGVIKYPGQIFTRRFIVILLFLFGLKS